jgi:type II secretory pathway pseudopilin PulG
MTRTGYSLIELLFVMSTTVTVSAIAIPQLLAAIDDYRTAGAVRYFSTRIQRTRMEAVSRSANAAIEFVPAAEGYAYGIYVDGNGDGVRTTDIRKGIDHPIGALEHLADTYAGVDFGLLPGLPPVDAGSPAPGADPIKLGSSNLLSYSPIGSSSSGSVYIRGRSKAQYVIRILGDTGRLRVLKFESRAHQWKAL